MRRPSPTHATDASPPGSRPRRRSRHHDRARRAINPPSWAYPVNPPDFKARTDDGSLRRVPGSAAGYMVTQLRDLFAAPVWHPDNHPALPPIVAQGRKPAVFACGVCHRADGPGGPENANIAGLPFAYIVQQMPTTRAARARRRCRTGRRRRT